MVKTVNFTYFRLGWRRLICFPSNRIFLINQNIFKNSNFKGKMLGENLGQISTGGFFTHSPLHTHISTHALSLSLSYTHTYTNTHTHTHTQTFTHTLTHTHTFTHMHTLSLSHTHTFTHIYTHTFFSLAHTHTQQGAYHAQSIVRSS